MHCLQSRLTDYRVTNGALLDCWPCFDQTLLRLIATSSHIGCRYKHDLVWHSVFCNPRNRGRWESYKSGVMKSEISCRSSSTLMCIVRPSAILLESVKVTGSVMAGSKRLSWFSVFERHVLGCRWSFGRCTFFIRQHSLRNAISLHKNETQYRVCKYSPCEWALPKRFSSKSSQIIE